MNKFYFEPCHRSGLCRTPPGSAPHTAYFYAMRTTGEAS